MKNETSLIPRVHVGFRPLRTVEAGAASNVSFLGCLTLEAACCNPASLLLRHIGDEEIDRVLSTYAGTLEEFWELFQTCVYALGCPGPVHALYRHLRDLRKE